MASAYNGHRQGDAAQSSLIRTKADGFDVDWIIEMNAPLAKEQIALLMSDSLTYRMTPVQGTDGTIADARPSRLTLLAQSMKRAVSALLALPRRRAVIDELSMLSDRELADIGLSRSELGRVFEAQYAANRTAI